MIDKKRLLINIGLFLTGIFVTLIVLELMSAATLRKAYSEQIDSGRQWAPPLAETLLGFGEITDEFEQNSSQEESRMVIKKGNINMVVRDIDQTVGEIIQYAKDKDGWVVYSSIVGGEDIPSGNVTIRVPADIFDETMTHLKDLAERVTYEGSSGEDITEEYTDLQSRLRNLEATEEQLLDIMNKSGTIPEVLEAQRELTKIRDQIELLKGRMQYLERSVEMATISINLALSEELLPIPPAEKWRPKYVFFQAWHSALSSLRNISYILIWIGVYSVIIVPLVILAWRVKVFWKRRMRKH